MAINTMKKATVPSKNSQPVCPVCHGKGYQGRLGVFEFIKVTDELQTIIRQTPDEIAIRQYALQNNHLSLLADALIKVLTGITDLEEIERVVGPLPENSL
jgi:type II secretory ATPase GspE/PulE/Tfp pilus assembly ATPase PilB-like protein